MDPLSITASALGVAANVLRTAFLVKEAIDQLRDAPDIVRDIEDDITITQAALRQVEAALGHDPQAIWRFRLDDVFDVSVKGCLDTLQRIEEEFESFFGRDDWRVRLGIWWNAGEIRRLRGRLEAKKGGLMLLVQALSLRSVQQMHDLLQQNRATLDIARRGLEDMVPSYPAYKDKDFDSVASELASDDSVLGDRDSGISHTRFPFDEICFGSKAYQRAVARVSSKKTHQLRTKASMPVRESYIPSVAESEAETESESSGETATPSAPTVVESAIHEAVCLKLQEAEARIRALEERIHLTPMAQLKNEALQEQLRLNALMRKKSASSKPRKSKQAKVEDIPTNVEAHENEEGQEKPAYLRSEGYDHYNGGDVPAPLKYVAYQTPRHVLSPIPEFSENTAGGTQVPLEIDEIYPSDSVSSLEKSRRQGEKLSWASVAGLLKQSIELNGPSSVPGTVTKAEAPFTTHHTEGDTRRTTPNDQSAEIDKPNHIASDRSKKDRRRRRSKAQDANGECKKITEEGGPFLAAMLGKDHDGSPSGPAEPAKVLLKGGRKINDQTALLIEYFEGGKGKASGDVRTPSVRVKVTPALKEQHQADHVQVSDARRRPLVGDAHTFPRAISAIPADKQSDEDILRRSYRQSTLDPADLSYRDIKATDGKTKSKEHRTRKRRSRTSGLEETSLEGKSKASLARLAARAEREALLNADGGPRIPFRSTINNPKLLETVEDAIARLILPELARLKLEQAKRTVKVNGVWVEATELKGEKGEEIAAELGHYCVTP
ncbi:hypothetical protein CONLIGDRAFT_451610 [Coniochaeta ligniaria NRRL 30616]|uniref:Fungal N-terminal domain-containing protein n=1 Tax=Coniochaeta ligniaria NRRL 30616 TaxID=1408157 RepID=A0A1J7IK07_9PEZI|nr:hypothetical protein CONLIGDRAFT_451610 [Coniochaeta ligniaria NRRL 30616]